LPALSEEAHQSETQTDAEPPGAPWQWEHLTGDWLRHRPWLEDRGVSVEATYLADFFYNTRGGLNTSDADQYRGLFDFSLTIDTGTLGLWQNGTFLLDFQDIHGRDITERHVGDLQVLNNSDAPSRTQLAEFWYEHAFFDGKLRVKIGKMDANADFDALDYGGEFIHSSPGFSPTIPLPTYPDPALGAAVFVEPADWMYLSAAVYDAEGEGDRSGFETAFHGDDASFSIVELGFRPVFRLAGRELPGTYRVGGWYHSGEWDRIFNDLDGRLSPRTRRGNAGLYLAFDQLAYKEQPSDEEDEQGLGVFFQFGWAPSSVNEITQHYGGGLQYVGLVPGRDDDVTGVTVQHVSLGSTTQSLDKRYSETAIEMFYKYQLTPFFSLKPDVQYIVNPGGGGRDALVVGIRTEISF
jgi:porin